MASELELGLLEKKALRQNRIMITSLGKEASISNEKAIEKVA